MNWSAVNFDWNHIRAFLATAEEGSLSAAARALRLTQPTLGRQVAAIEDELGVVLFERVGRSLELTPSGRDLLEHVRAMGEAATRVSLSATGQSQSVEGKVSITASDIFSAVILPHALAEIRARAPGIEIEVVAANDIRDIQRREADIAVRHVEPNQPELIAKKVGRVTGRLYGATRYLDRVGRPKTVADLARMDGIAIGDPGRTAEEMAKIGMPLTRDNFRIATDNGLVFWEYVRHGLGLGMMEERLGDATPEVEVVLPDLPRFEGFTWLTTHRELQTSKRIRLVFDVLVDIFANERYLKPRIQPVPFPLTQTRSA